MSAWRLSTFVLLTIIVYNHFYFGTIAHDEGFCQFEGTENCLHSSSSLLPKYLLYDVNPPEGFNLRRDVYMRLAIFMREFRKSNPGWLLVLPPWHHLYHWRSTDVGEQTNIPWSHFFDIESMKKFSPVIEFEQFIQEWGERPLDDVFLLQHYPDAFKPGYEFGDKWDFQPCNAQHFYTENEDGKWVGWFWGWSNLSGTNFNCISFEGSASGLSDLLKSSSPSRSVVLDRAEVILHDAFGNKRYWECRRSMRFSKQLKRIANSFMKEQLSTTNVTSLPEDWTKEKVGERRAVGGPFLGVHLRRRDFLIGRSSKAVLLREVGEQISKELSRLGLDTVFVASDAPPSEMKELKKLLDGWDMVRFEPTQEERRKLKDGGVAIIDQIICSQARWFIGTYESTFSFRIQEEREILGFPIETTFNRFCPLASEPCEKPTQWTIR